MNRELAEQLDLPTDSGVLVMQVVPGSAAAHAGIQGGNQRVYYGNYEIIIGGDLIVEIDGQEVKDTQDLAHLMNNHRSGDYRHHRLLPRQKAADRPSSARRSQERHTD